MSSFTEAEIEFMRGQRLGRLATVNAAGEPHISPVGFRYNAELDTIDIGGRNMGRSKKVRDVQGRPVVAFVVDDVLPPWRPRGVEIRGRAEVLQQGGEQFGPGYDTMLIRIHPRRIIGWGIDTGAFGQNARNVEGA